MSESPEPQSPTLSQTYQPESEHEEPDVVKKSITVALTKLPEQPKVQPSTTKGRKPAVKPVVTRKEYEFTFLPEKSGHVGFLRELLSALEITKYKLVETRPFLIRYTHNPGRNKSNVLDVENEKDWDNLVRHAENPKEKIEVQVNMADIEKKCLQDNDTGEAASESDNEKEENEQVDATMSSLDKMMAHFRGKLLEKYGDKSRPNDQTGTYVYKDGRKVHLNQHRLGIWSRDIAEGKATVFKPPEHSAFDPSNTDRELTARNAKSGSQTQSDNVTVTPTDTTSAVMQMATSMATLATAFVSSGSAHAPTKPNFQATPFARSSKGHNDPASLPGSPPIPSPSDLARFLRHAEDKLGIKHARVYEAPFKHNRYGPDILHKVPDEKLVEAGVPLGDVIRLKDGCQAWWKGPEAKRKRNDNEDNNVGAGPDAAPPTQRVRYETIFPNDEGAYRFTGGTLLPAGDHSSEDKITKYFNEATGAWHPIPPGFTINRSDPEVIDPFRDEEDDYALF